MKKFGDWKSTIRSEIWPSAGEPKSLRSSHDSHFQEAMVEIAQWVPCLQKNNTTVWPFCSTYVTCALSAVAQPQNGLIKKVYTIAGDDHCDKVWYVRQDYSEIVRWSNALMANWTAPLNTGLAALQQSFKVAEADSDSAYGRSRVGIFSTWRNRIYMAPWIQSTESIVVEWDGPKLEWNDEDLIYDDVWTVKPRLAVKLYVQYAHERDFGCSKEFLTKFRSLYNEALAELIYWCKERERQGKDEEEKDLIVRAPSATEVEDDDDVTETTEEDLSITFANVGDFGGGGSAANTLLVADLVKSWDDGAGRFFITHNGDVFRTGAEDYAEVMEPFIDYVTDDLSTNRFWPAPGNHDADLDTGRDLTAWKAFFTLPGNERYYDVVVGPCHFFFLNTSAGKAAKDTEEPDGASSTSPQAMWLKAKLALSTAQWKIVIDHYSAYSSSQSNPGNVWMRWPFKKWGATLMISGHDHVYERLLADDPVSADGQMQYLVNGCGGANTDASGTAIAQSELQYAGYGAIKGTADCDTLTLEFFSTDGVLRDTLEITA